MAQYTVNFRTLTRFPRGVFQESEKAKAGAEV